jgi:hypothetical protein
MSNEELNTRCGPVRLVHLNSAGLPGCLDGRITSHSLSCWKKTSQAAHFVDLGSEFISVIKAGVYVIPEPTPDNRTISPSP